MESWLKLVAIWTLVVAAFAKETDERAKTEETDAEMSFIHPAAMPMMPFYRFQYPVYAPGYQMYTDSEEEEVQPPHVRSMQRHSKPETAEFEDSSPSRREVRLWPRPCGWEWDGNQYRWGPCNIFFGGPGFPW